MRTFDDERITVKARMEIEFNLHPTVYFTPTSMALTISARQSTVRRVIRELFYANKLERNGDGYYKLLQVC